MAQLKLDQARNSKDANNRFFRIFCALPEREINAKVSVSFSSLIDLTAIEAIRSARGAKGYRRPSYTAFVAKALAVALQEHPYANRRVFRSPWHLGGPWLHDFQAIDITVAAERSVPKREYIAFVDVMRNADQLSLEEVTEWLAELAQSDESTNRQWRELNQLIERMPWRIAAFILRLPTWIPSMWERYRGGAVLVSSPAKYGVDGVTASWAWPIGVSFGFVKPRPLVRDGQVVVCPTFQLLMNFDRRIMAGAAAARLFKRICDLLENEDEISAVIGVLDSQEDRSSSVPTITSIHEAT